jgi:uncharacterized sulfatase
MPSPNILFIFSDQQRWDTLGCYGQRLPVTPHLDALAAEGVRFEHAFTCQPVCGPARACLQTGRYATEIGCFTNDRGLPDDARTLAHWLGDAGYETGYLGKWHLAGRAGEHYTDAPVPPHRRGGYRDFWLASDILEFTSHGEGGHMYDADMRRVDFAQYRADALTDFAVDYLRTRDGRRPFFLFLSYIEPHHQNDRNRFEGPPGSQARWADYDVPGDLVETAGDWRENYPDYLGCCHALDAGVGRLRATLAEQGLAENTLVIYTSDHGCHFRTRNGEYKRAAHDACLHIPLLLHGPGFTGGRVESCFASLLDLPPTVLAAAGVTPPPVMAGRPLQAIDAPDWPEEIFAQISEDHIGRVLRTARWKYSIHVPDEPFKSGWTQPGSDVYYEECLYDLDADPHERTNLVRDPAHAALRATLAAQLAARMARAGEAPPEIRPAV